MWNKKILVNIKNCCSLGPYISGKHALRIMLLVQWLALLVHFVCSIYSTFFYDSKHKNVQFEGAYEWYKYFVFVYFNAGNGLSVFLLWKGIKETSKRFLMGFIGFKSLYLILSIPVFILLKMLVTKEDINEYKYRVVTLNLVYCVEWYSVFIVLNYYNKLTSSIMAKLQEHCDLLKKEQQYEEHWKGKNNIYETCTDSLVTPETDFQSFQKHLISPWNIFIDTNNVLGEGGSGTVYKSIYRFEKSKKIVAAKISKTGTDSETLGMLLQEIKIHIHAGDHENIIRFYGVTSDASLNGHVAIITEYCSFGSLMDFLKEKRHTFVNHLRESSIGIHPEKPLVYINLNEFGTHSTIDLLRFCLHIATGMEHLASKKIVHGDLSSRNILITEDLQVKISDFGMSRKLYSYQLYCSHQEKGQLPWRWMSIEAIEDLKLSEKSDVWSFGVLCWEIFSLGEFPFEGIQWSHAIPKKIRDGMRLEKPTFANFEIYKIMKHCWSIDPQKRPHFSDLKQWFHEIYQKNRLLHDLASEKLMDALDIQIYK